MSIWEQIGVIMSLILGLALFAACFAIPAYQLERDARRRANLKEND